MATQLSANFTLEELVHSDYALRQDIDNSTDDTDIIAALTALAVKLLQPVRRSVRPLLPDLRLSLPRPGTG